MKVAISVPDPIFGAAERIARRSGKSRSQIYAEALSEYIKVHDPKAITEQLNAVYADEDSSVEPGFYAATLEGLKRNEW